LADRFGNVKVVIAGTFVYALGMVLMPGVDSPWRLNASAGILVGAGIAGTSFGIILPAMARAVGPERQQWALGLGTAAGSIGQFAIVPVSQFLIDAYGWGPALNILAGSALIMALLCRLHPIQGDRCRRNRKRTRRFRKHYGRHCIINHFCCWSWGFLSAVFMWLSLRRTCRLL
jgi:MFS family permease